MAAMTRRQWMQGAALAAVCAMPGVGLAEEEKPRARAESKDQPAKVQPAKDPEPKGQPTRSQPIKGQPTKGQPVKGQKVNINEASRAELMKLEGVGAGAADRIIAHRDARGPFKRVQDLERVDKVGKAVLEKNPGRIVVR